ncbi:hypothetical protein TKK_0009005 [Trichogramma kaykai]|uniref:SANT and BTB domain-containing protein n=1 Tax=Trichogramma kaykai TaxID=54128 RepID=A0ABD2X3X6_9HYME
MFPNLFKNPSCAEFYEQQQQQQQHQQQKPTASSKDDKPLQEAQKKELDKSCSSSNNSECRSRDDATDLAVEGTNYAELSVKAFFDFMRVAYQVNDNFPDIASAISANSQIDWNALASFSLHDSKETGRDSGPSAALESNEPDETARQEEEPLLSVQPVQAENEAGGGSSGNGSSPSEARAIKSKSSPAIGSLQLAKGTSSGGAKSAEHDEPMLAKVMKRCLSDVLHEGLLDSVLPYMIPKSALQAIGKKATPTSPPRASEPKKPPDDRFPPLKETPSSKDKLNKQKKLSEAEVEIHVCDEAKNIKKDFRCPQRLLIQKMCYFADVTAGQKLEEMDISVHCDVAIFDWLMRWVKKDLIKKSEWPRLEAANVVPIMVSASFLQMSPLLEDCLAYCHANLSEVLATSAVLSCLNDALLTRLAERFSNADLEAVRDKKDKVQSRLFCKLILALAEPKPEARRGHYGTLATLFRCARCRKNVGRPVSLRVPCTPDRMSIDPRGDVHSKHTRDTGWSLNEHVLKLRAELRSWRKVYWRLWGDCHFLFCRQCATCFPVSQMAWCAYHPDNPQFFVNEQQRATPFPLGRYPCCSQRAYRFQALANRDGCKFREHVPEIRSENDERIVDLFLAHRDHIAIEPPQLFFPEKITRLVARDSTLPAGKLACKETFWWEGIEILPPRPKFGLLARLWGGSSIHKRPLQTPRRSWTAKEERRRPSRSATDFSSSIASSDTCDDEDEVSPEDEHSSDPDESLESEQSRDMELPSVKKLRNLSNIRRVCDGMGTWSANLTVRYNQDNQRDFEEKAAGQMIALLTKRTVLERNLRPKSHSPNKHFSWNTTSQPIGGTYIRLESEFFGQVAQNYKCKTNTQAKCSLRVKSSK